MQVQSSTDPPKKLALGERAVMADGNEYNVVLLKEAGQPVEPVYPAEGTPTISGPTGIFASRAASERRAAVPGLAASPAKPSNSSSTSPRNIRFTRRCRPSPAAASISDIKLMKEDPAGVEKMAEEIKTRYARLFRV